MGEFSGKAAQGIGLSSNKEQICTYKAQKHIEQVYVLSEDRTEP